MKRRKIAAKSDEALAETQALARLHVPEALEELARLAREAASENVRVTAIKEILDRAYGRTPASLADGAGGIVKHLLVDDGYPD